MLGAVAGDIVGSRHEFRPCKRTDFELLHPDCAFTDDTVMTVAVADALLEAGPGAGVEDFRRSLVEWARRYPDAGYGPMFNAWFREGGERPYGSMGNGSCMRVSPVAWLGRDLADVARLAVLSALPSHDHHHGVKGAVAVAVATRMALEGFPPDQVGEAVSRLYGPRYRTDIPTERIRPNYGFKVLAQNSAPPSIRCAMEGVSWEASVRLAVSLGGDADTMAAMAGGIAEGFARAAGDPHPVPGEVEAFVRSRLPPDMLDVLDRFAAATAGMAFPRSDLGALEPMPDPEHDLAGNVLHGARAGHDPLDD